MLDAGCGPARAEALSDLGPAPVSLPQLVDELLQVLFLLGRPGGFLVVRRFRQQVVDDVRRQSANPLDPRVQEQVAQVQQQVAAKRAELDEQKRNLLQQQAQVRELEMEQIVDQGQLESFCDIQVGDNLVSKMQVAVVVRDGVIEAIEQG